MERFLSDYAYVHRRFDDVCRLLESYPQRVLEPAASKAAHESRELMRDVVATLHVGMGQFELARDIRVEMEEFDRDDHVARLSFRWEAARGGSLFPTMHADLELYALANEPRPLTQLAFIGHYRPPLRLLGAAGDAMVGRRVAEAAVHHFVKEIRDGIERELSPTGVGKYLVTSHQETRR